MIKVKSRSRNRTNAGGSQASANDGTLVERILKRLHNHPVIAVTIVFAAAVAGLASLAKNVQDIWKMVTGEKPKLEEVARDLGSTSMEARIVAVTSLSRIEAKNKAEAEKMVRMLEAFINRRAASNEIGSRTEQPEDVIAAFTSLSTILKAADESSLNVSKPQFSGLTLAALDLSGVYLRGASFSKTSFDDAVLDRADLSMVLFVDVQFVRVKARGLQLSSAHIRASCFEEAVLEHATLDFLEASSSDFNSVIMKDSSLKAARFENTRLANVNFEGANLAEIDLRSGLELIEQQLRKAKSLNGAKLPNPIYMKSRLSVCNPQ